MSKPPWSSGEDLLDNKNFQQMVYPKPIFAKGDFIKYDNKIYRIADINFKCYECIQIQLASIAGHKDYLLIASANAHAKHMGTDLDIVRMLFL